MKLAIVATLCLASNLAMAAIKVSRGSLHLSVDPALKGLIMNEPFKDVTIVVDPMVGQVTLTANLVAQNDKKLASYIKQWELRTLGTTFARTGIWAKAGIASTECQSTTANGAYTHLKGVCLEDLIIKVPVGLQTQISSDKKMVLIGDASISVDTVEVISADDIKELTSTLKKAAFSSDRRPLLERFVQEQRAFGANRISVNDLDTLMKTQSFDDGKLEVLRAVSPFISNRLEAYEVIVKQFVFSSAHAEALAALFE